MINFIEVTPVTNPHGAEIIERPLLVNVSHIIAVSYCKEKKRCVVTTPFNVFDVLEDYDFFKAYLYRYREAVEK